MSNCYEINSPHVISESLSGETVIINLQTGTYHNLNDNGSRIWQALSEPVDLQSLAQAIACEDPQVGPAQIEMALSEWMRTLAEQGLVRISRESVPSQRLQPIVVPSLDWVCESYTDMQDLLGLDPIHEADSETGWPHKPSPPLT
jgi:hypothetical protein